MASPSRWKWKAKFRTKSDSRHTSGHPQNGCHSSSNQGNCHQQGNHYEQHDRRGHSNHSWNRRGSRSEGEGFGHKKGRFKHKREESAGSEYCKDTSKIHASTTDQESSVMEGNASLRLSQNGSSTQDQSGTSTPSSNQSQVMQIPGFYYDPEKKKYFRLLQGHNNHNPLTAAGIQLKSAEVKRVQMIEGNMASRNTNTSKNRPVKTRVTGATQLLQLLRDRQHDHLTRHQYARYAHEQCVSLLPVKATCELRPFPDNYFNGEEGCITFLKMDEHEERVLLVIQDSFLSRIWQGTIKCDDKKHGRVAITDWKTVNILGTRGAKITNVAWGSADMNGDIRVLYQLLSSYHLTRYSVSGGACSVAQVIKCSFQESSSSPRWRKEVIFGYENVHDMFWTCAWSHNPQLQPQFSIGISRRAVVLNMRTANRRELFSGHSDVLAQVYSSHQPILYNGTRCGEILGCDLRTPSQSRGSMSCQLKHKVCLCSIKTLKDENYLLASDISGKVKLWDLRQRRCVQNYEGLVNKHSQLPVFVDSTETVIYGTGSDKCTQFWSLQDGRMLHSIPCPAPIRNEGIPTPAYSRHWYGGATPGLILGMERQLFWYSLSS